MQVRKVVVLVVIALIAACASRSTSETDEIAACQAKGGRWSDEGCSRGRCEAPNGATSAPLEAWPVDDDPDDDRDDDGADSDSDAG